jgi:signal peptidase I
MHSVTRRHLAGALAFAVLAVTWYVLAPPQLGGSTTYAVVHGTSMEPRFHRGDLVLLRTASEYRVGDIAAYQSPELGRTVMHRIVRKAGDRYQFKGDNNDFLDSAAPQRVELAGKHWLRIPAAGKLLGTLRTPALAALLAGLLALLLAGGNAQKGRRRRRRSGDGGAPALQRVSLDRGRVAGALRSLDLGRIGGAVRSLDRQTLDTALLVCGVVGACSVLLALLAFTRPSERAVERELYSQTGTFAYVADAPKGTVYPSGRVRTGQTVFTRLVDRVEVRFAYRLRSTAPRSVFGTTKLVAELRGDNGWQHELVLQPRKVFEGDRVIVRGTLDLKALAELGRRVQAQTETVTDSYALTLKPVVELTGTLGAEPVKTRFAPVLALRLNSSSLRLDTASPSAAEQTALVRAKKGYGTGAEANTLSLLGLELRVRTARMVALLGGIGALAAAALLALGLVREREGDEPALIATRYDAWLVDVAPRPRTDEYVLDVTTMEGLVRLAERYDRMILHELFEGAHSYLVEEDGVVYRYRTGTPEPEPAPLRSVKAAKR